MRIGPKRGRAESGGKRDAAKCLSPFFQQSAPSLQSSGATISRISFLPHELRSTCRDRELFPFAMRIGGCRRLVGARDSGPPLRPGSTTRFWSLLTKVDRAGYVTAFVGGVALPFFTFEVRCLEAHNTSRMIRDELTCRSIPARVPRLRPDPSSCLQLDRTPGHLSSLPRPISCFLVGRRFSLANEGRVLLTATRRGTDRDGIAKSRVVCRQESGPVCATANLHKHLVAERTSPHRACHQNALARPPRA